jgi:hypothetical protein
MALHLSGYLAKQGVPRDQTLGIIERLAIGDEDPGSRVQAAHDSYDALEAGEEVSGYYGLRDVCGHTDVDLAPLEVVMREFWRGTRTPSAVQEATGRIVMGNARGTTPFVSAQSNWPTLDPAAFQGLAGDVVRMIEPHTEGDSVAVLSNFLTMFGSALNRGPHALVGPTPHHANLFAVMVGQTARGRKGTAYAEPRRLMRIADPGWAAGRIVGGLSSGEGLIYQVRDEVVKTTKKGEEALIDPGESDKRLLVVEEEYSSVLHMIDREGNTLSEVIRRAWDGEDLRTLTKHSPLRATAPHISILGHITQDELLRVLGATERVNGFANRFLFLLVKRSKLLPHGGSLTNAEIAALARRITNALQEARKRGVMRRDDEANRMWEAVYPALTRERPGMLGAIANRAEAQVLRLSLVYALIDGAMAIQRPHVEAALALWKYAEDSATYIFGDAIGDPVADTILRALRASGAMTQTQLSELFGRNQNAARLQQALVLLLTLGKVRTWAGESVKGGRVPTWWEAIP